MNYEQLYEQADRLLMEEVVEDIKNFLILNPGAFGSSNSEFDTVEVSQESHYNDEYDEQVFNLVLYFEGDLLDFDDYDDLDSLQNQLAEKHPRLNNIQSLTYKL